MQFDCFVPFWLAEKRRNLDAILVNKIMFTFIYLFMGGALNPWLMVLEYKLNCRLLFR